MPPQIRDAAMATPLILPFTRETATAKVRMADDGWNSRDP
jgi:nuclear transport factor 2 (NTF2) superfamily protein